MRSDLSHYLNFASQNWAQLKFSFGSIELSLKIVLYFVYWLTDGTTEDSTYMLNSAQKFKLIAMFYFWFDPKLKSPVWTYSILLPAFFPWFLIFTIHHNYVLLILDGVVFYWIKAKSIKLIERLRKQSLPFCLRKSIFVKF